MVVDLPLLPLEIWAYIFAIRRCNFELLIFKFEKEMLPRIRWKSQPDPFGFCARLTTIYAHHHRSGYYWGEAEPYVIRFYLHPKTYSNNAEYYFDKENIWGQPSRLWIISL